MTGFQVLREGGNEAQQLAAGALRHLAQDIMNHATILEGGGLEALTKVLLEGTLPAQAHAAEAFQQLSCNNENRDKFQELIQAW